MNKKAKSKGESGLLPAPTGATSSLSSMSAVDHH
jgi:hypothetical protein